jgi:hypothetical protein
MQTTMAIVFLASMVLILAVISVVVFKGYRGLIKIKGPGFELTVDGRNQAVFYEEKDKALQPTKAQKDP